MARQPPDGDREDWVQSNTQFHQDWTARENRGESLRWKPGISLEPAEGDRPKKYAVQIASRRPRRWLLWLMMLALLIGAAWMLLGDVNRLE